MRQMSCGVVVVALVFGSAVVWSQDADKELKGRLPNNYGKLELSDKQKQAIYAVQKKHGDQIDALVRQVEELRQKRDNEIEAVLTAEQKEKLKSLTSETAKKTSAKKTGKTETVEKPKAEEPVPAKPPTPGSPAKPGNK